MDNFIMVPGVLVDSTNDTRTVSSPHWTAVVLHLLNWKHSRWTELISSWKSAVEKFEIRHIQELESKWDLRKSGPPPTSNFECQICHQMCRSRIGLLAHNKSHSWWWDPSRRRLSPWLAFGPELILISRSVIP